MAFATNVSGLKDKRVLCFVEAISLGHVGRLARTAGWLARAGAKVSICAPETHHKWFSGVDADLYPISVIDQEVFYGRFADGDAPYDAQTLDGYLKEDRALIERLRPDLVLADFRFSAVAVAQHLKTPTAALLEATVLPQFNFMAGSVPDTFLKPHWAPPALVKRFLASSVGMPVVRSATKKNVAPWCTAFEAAGLEPPESFLDLAGSADLCLVGDIPGLVDAPARPKDIFIGPLFFDFPGAQTFHLPSPEDKTVRRAYVTIGTQAAERVSTLETACRALLDDGWQLFVSGGGRAEKWSPEHGNLTFLPFVNEAELFPHVDLVVHPGGAMTSYRCIAFKLPQLLVPAHPNQHFLADALQKHGLGRLLRRRERDLESWRVTANALIEDPAVRAALKAWQGWARLYDAEAICLSAISGLLKAGSRSRIG